MSVEANKNLGLKTAKNWRYIINEYLSGRLNQFNIKPKKNLNTEKIIWQYWGQGLEAKKLPDVVKASFNSVDLNKNGYTVIRLDDKTIHEYLELPDFVWDKLGKNNFRHVLFSDLLRLALLNAYGGIWIDATIMLCAPIPTELLTQDFFVFQRDPNATNKTNWYEFSPSYFCWDKDHLVNILSSFMIAKKNNQVIHLWLDLLLNYWQTQDSIYHYHFFQILFEELMVNDLYSLRGKLIDDTLPHLLFKKANDMFSEDEMKNIIEICPIQKLTYLKKRVHGSFYDHILKTFLKN